MADMTQDEEILASGGVPIRGASTSAADVAEEGEVDEEYDAMIDPENIRRSKPVVTARSDKRPLTRARAASRQPSRLTFGTVDSSALGGAPSPRKNPSTAALTLDDVDMIAKQNKQPVISNPRDEAAKAAAELLRSTVNLTKEGSALHSSIRAALGFHDAWLKDNQKTQADKAAATAVNAAATKALLLRLEKASISDDEEDPNDTLAERADKNRIRIRKNQRLIDKKKQEGEAKDMRSAPSEPLALNHRLHDHHDFLALQMFFMNVEEAVSRKDWCSPVELWVFRQIEKGSKAHTAFHVFLKSGQGLQLQMNNCYFRDFLDFKDKVSGVFFTELRDPIAVIESSMKRVKLTVHGVDGPTTPTTLEGFCNTIRFLCNQAPLDASYPERQQVSRIRERLPKQVETHLLEWEVNNRKVINSYLSLTPCLHRQDVLFSDSKESKTPNQSSHKRPAHEAALQVAEVFKGPKKPRAIDNRPPCAFCHKPGHLAEVCWSQFPEKRRSYNERGRRPNAPPLPLNNITTASLQAMISQAVENVIASVKHP